MTAMHHLHALVRPLLLEALDQPDRLGLLFYRRLFALAPAVRSLFPEDMDGQRAKLTRTIASLLDAIEEPERAGRMLRNLGLRHSAYRAEASHYPVVGMALEQALEEMRQRPFTAEEKEAWSGFYAWLSQQMIEGAEAAGLDPIG